MNGDQTDPSLSPEFFRGQSYLGKPTTISLAGQEPGGPSSSLAAGGIAAPATGPGGIPGIPGKVTGGGIPTGGGSKPTWATLVGALQQGFKGVDLAKKLFGDTPPSFQKSPAAQAQKFGEIAPVYQPLLAAGWTPQEVNQAVGLFGQAAPADIQALLSGPGAGTAEVLKTGLTAPISEGGFLAEGAAGAGGGAGLSFGDALPGIGAGLAAGTGLFQAVTAPTDIGKAFGAAEAVAAPLLVINPPVGAAVEGLLGLGNFLSGLFGGKPSVYDIKRQAAKKTAATDVAGLQASLKAGTQPGLNPAQQLTALNFLSGDISAIPGRNPVRSSILMSPDQATALGVTGTPTLGAVSVDWAKLTPAQFSAVLKAMQAGSVSPYMQNPTPGAGNPPVQLAKGQFQVLGSGDVAYLPYAQAVGVANQAATSTADYLTTLVAQLSKTPPAAAPAAPAAAALAPPSDAGLQFPAPPATGSGEVFPFGTV